MTERRRFYAESASCRPRVGKMLSCDCWPACPRPSSFAACLPFGFGSEKKFSASQKDTTARTALVAPRCPSTGCSRQNIRLKVRPGLLRSTNATAWTYKRRTPPPGPAGTPSPRWRCRGGPGKLQRKRGQQKQPKKRRENDQPLPCATVAAFNQPAADSSTNKHPPPHALCTTPHHEPLLFLVNPGIAAPAPLTCVVRTRAEHLQLPGPGFQKGGTGRGIFDVGEHPFHQPSKGRGSLDPQDVAAHGRVDVQVRRRVLQETLLKRIGAE